MLTKEIQQNTHSENCGGCQDQGTENSADSQMIPTAEQTDDSFIPENQRMHMDNVHRIDTGGDETDQLSDKAICRDVPECVFTEQEQTDGLT